MTKIYTRPALRVHGRLETLTEGFTYGNGKGCGCDKPKPPLTFS